MVRKPQICQLQGWDGDNSCFIEAMLPGLELSDYDKLVLAWAYGLRGSAKSWEKESDGETLVADWFLHGSIKCPAGVVHDMLNRLPCHTTPDGKVWTVWDANAIYYRLQRALGAPIRLRVRRWIGLTISGVIPERFGGWWRQT